MLMVISKGRRLLQRFAYGTILLQEHVTVVVNPLDDLKQQQIQINISYMPFA